MERKNTGLIVVIVILSLVIVGLGGFIVYDKVLNKDSKIETKEEDNEVQVEDKKDSNISKLDENKDIVYSGVTYNITGHNDKMNGLSEIPQINLDCENIKQINNEIIDLFKDIMMVDEFKDNYKYGFDESCDKNIYKVQYEYYNNDNVLSLLITYKLLSEEDIEPDYIIYNIDTNTGNILTNKDLIEYGNYSVEKLKENLRNNMENYYKEIYNQYNIEYKFGNNINGVYLYDESQATINTLVKYIDKYNTVMLPLFINKEGKLSFYANVPVPGGYGSYAMTFSLE